MTIDKEEIIEDISYSKIPKKQKVEKISKYLQDSEPEVVCAACNELGRLKARGAINQIAELMASANGEITNLAICSLVEMIDSRDDALLPELHRNLDNSHYLTVLSSVEALGKIQSNESIPFLLNMLNTHKSGLKARVIISMGEIGDQKALPVLEICLAEILEMDYGVRDRGGPRGSELHPRALEAFTREAIEAIKERST